MTAAQLPQGYTLVHLPEADSTNAEALRRVFAGERGPLWVFADRQSAGRGRDGRPWTSLPGNLHASLLFAPDCPVQRAAQLSLVAGVAAIEGLRKAGPLDLGASLRLKWPNDILIGAAKVGGILIESTNQVSASRLAVVIGVGINLAAAPQEAGRPATSLAAHGLALSPREALCFLAEAMHTWIGVWGAGAGFARVREAWLERAGALGEALTVHGPAGPIEGRFAGLDADGALLVIGADGREQRVRFGDVALASGEAKGTRGT